jgi:hypothetical protein
MLSNQHLMIYYSNVLRQENLKFYCKKTLTQLYFYKKK